MASDHTACTSNSTVVEVSSRIFGTRLEERQVIGEQLRRMEREILCNE